MDHAVAVQADQREVGQLRGALQPHGAAPRGGLIGVQLELASTRPLGPDPRRRLLDEVETWPFQLLRPLTLTTSRSNHQSENPAI